MSSDSEESSLSSVPQREHLSHIWKSIQQTKNISAMVDRRENSQHMHHYQLSKPKTRKYPQSQQKENLAHLSKKIRKLQNQNEQLHFQLQEERQLRFQEVEQLKKSYEDKLHAQLRKLKASQKENREVNKGQRQKVDSFIRENEKLSLKVKALELDNRNLQAERLKLAQLNHIYACQLSQDKEVDQTQVGRAQQLLQLQEAQQTVSRLVELLRKSEEYKEYGLLMGQIKNMHYLKGILKRLKVNQLNLKPIDKKICSCRQMKINQKLLWSPVQCYKTMLEMKVKYDYLSQDCIEEVLFEMNRIYVAKEQKTIQKLKQIHQNEIIKLKKQLQQGYDEVLTKKQIHRLKKELKTVKSAQKTKAPTRLNQLRDQGQLEDLLKMKERQIKLLKERIKLFQTESGLNDKSLYYEGTLCALDKVLAELDSNEASLKEFEIRFRERVEDNMSPEDWLASYKQFFEGLQQLNGELAQRILALKESILVKMSKGQ